MARFLSPDNGFFSFINKFIDIIAISFLWGITSLLLFTMGPATCAAYYTMVKVIRRERGYAMRSFFHSFKENFKEGSLAGLIFWVYAVIAVVDIFYARSLAVQQPTAGHIMQAIFITISIFAAFIAVWAFPILSRFTLPLKGLLTNSLVISIKHFPRTIVMVGMIGAELWLIYNYVPLPFYPILFITMPAFSILIRSFIAEPVLKKYLPEAEGTPEETGEDQWYRE